MPRGSLASPSRRTARAAGDDDGIAATAAGSATGEKGRAAFEVQGKGNRSSNAGAMEMTEMTVDDAGWAEVSPRMWSNLDGSMAHAPGSLAGAIALVAGTTVGAGMLALPAVCQDSGFVPSSFALVACWVYMVSTGLLVLEVNVSTMCELGGGGASIISMAERTLGTPGTRFAWGAYVFLHYALLVAYISRSGEMIYEATDGAVPAASAAVAYALLLGGFTYAAPSRLFESFNNVLVLLVIGTFLPLLLIAGGSVDSVNLVSRADWSAVPNTIPVIALAFVFHNIVPVVSSSLEGDRRKTRIALVAGTAIPFAMFMLWNAAILGSVSAEDAAAASMAVAAGGPALDPLAAVRSISPTAAALVQSFSFFAISTSFLGFVLGLTDFLSDGLQLSTGGKKDIRAFALCLVPPTIFAISYPDIFLSALDSAGTFGVLTLFGCMPPMMAWNNRYSGTWDAEKEMGGPSSVFRALTEPMVPGGKVGLGVLFSLAAGVVLSETLETLEKVTAALGQ